jgi:hypothetical protein
MPSRSTAHLPKSVGVTRGLSLSRWRIVLVLGQTVGDVKPWRLAANKDMGPGPDARVAIERCQCDAVLGYRRSECSRF